MANAIEGCMNSMSWICQYTTSCLHSSRVRPSGEASSSGFASRDCLAQRQANIDAKHWARDMVDRVVAGAGPALREVRNWG
jgi:hypothetical protein